MGCNGSSVTAFHSNSIAQDNNKSFSTIIVFMLTIAAMFK